MDILIFDQTKYNGPIDYMQPLVEHIDNLNAIVLTNLDEAQNSFAQSLFDFIIVDFSTQDGNAFLQHILATSAQQKIITLSHELISSNENCEVCERLHNKRRLIKPVEPVKLYHTLKHFNEEPCKYRSHFHEPKVLLEDLLNRYDYFYYDKEEETIFKEQYVNDFVLKEYIDLVNCLKRYAIKYEIQDEYTIKII